MNRILLALVLSCVTALAAQRPAAVLPLVSDLDDRTPVTGETVVTLGVASVGDYRLEWYWDASDTNSIQSAIVRTNAQNTVGRYKAYWDGDVRAFGVFSGSTNTAGIQAALSAGAKKIVFPPGTYYVDSPLTNSDAVEMVGDGATLSRRFWVPDGNTGTGAYDYTKRFLLQLAPGSKLVGITIDGGSDQTTISTFGSAAMHSTYTWMDTNGVLNQTVYGDVAIYGSPDGAGAPVVIENCVFRNAPGSSIKNSEVATSNVKVINSTFLGYNDHAIYFAGWPSLSGDNLPAQDILISGNTINVTNQTRANTAVKLRNLVSRASILGNHFNITNDIAISLDGGDAVGGNGNLGPVIVANNDGTVRYFLAMSDISTNLTDSWNVLVEGNNINIYNDGVSGYVFGVSPTQTGPSGVGIIRGNQFKTVDPDAVAYLYPAGYNTPSALLEPTRYVIENNFFDGQFLIQPYGQMALTLKGNTFFDRRGPDTNNFPYLINVATATANHLPSGTSIPWVIEDNTFVNYATVIYDADASVTTDPGNGNALIAGHRLRLIGNKMFGHPSRGWLLDWRGTNIAAYAGGNFVEARDNLCQAVLGSFNTLNQTNVLQFWNRGTNVSDTVSAKAPFVTFGDTNQNTALTINSGTGKVSQLYLSSDGIPRMEIRKTSTDDMQFVRRNSSGSSLGTPIWIDADNGYVGILDQTSPGVPLDVLGDVALGAGSTASQYLIMRSAAGYQRMLELRSSAAKRWRAGANTTAEGGSDAGSDFDFVAYDDAGSALGAVARISRALPSVPNTSFHIFYNTDLRDVGVTNINGAAVLYLIGVTP